MIYPSKWSDWFRDQFWLNYTGSVKAMLVPILFFYIFQLVTLWAGDAGRYGVSFFDAREIY
jgi:hypothetical protein